MPRDWALAVGETDDAFDCGAARLRTSVVKRLIDIVGAAIGLVFLSPFLIIVAVCVFFEHPGPVIFRQRRTGLGGAPFVIYKFRTMTVLEDGHTVVQATRDDGRTTPLGRFLRRTSIDELPQLANVLKGEMSLVGPRPHALAHDQIFAAAVSGYNDRFVTRPGLTGLAQASGLRGEMHGVPDMQARLALDVEYIRRWSVGLDLEIILRTVMLAPFDPAAH